jgi:hypothetical protein
MKAAIHVHTLQSLILAAENMDHTYASGPNHMGQRDVDVLLCSPAATAVYSLNVRPQAAGIVEGTLDGHSPESKGGFVREGAIAIQPAPATTTSRMPSS